MPKVDTQVTLLPCPFCGGEAAVKETDDDIRVRCGRCFARIQGHAHPAVSTWPEAQRTSGRNNAKQGAIKEWNRRCPIIDSPEEGKRQVEELTDRLRERHWKHKGGDVEVNWEALATLAYELGARVR